MKKAILLWVLALLGLLLLGVCSGGCSAGSVNAFEASGSGFTVMSLAEDTVVLSGETPVRYDLAVDVWPCSSDRGYSYELALQSGRTGTEVRAVRTDTGLGIIVPADVGDDVITVTTRTSDRDIYPSTFRLRLKDGRQRACD